MILLLGVDPGDTAAFVLVRAEPGPRGPQVREIVASSCLGMSGADVRGSRNVRSFHRLCDRLRTFEAPAQVALEFPKDAKPWWATRRQGRGHMEQTGNSFTLGQNTALVEIALATVWPDVPVSLYRVQEWFRGRRRETVLATMSRAWAGFGGPDVPNDHQCMALGVVLHHAAQGGVK